MSQKFYTDSELVPFAYRVSTREQKEQLRKIISMGWEIGRVMGNDRSRRYAISAVMKNTVVWLLPDGSLKRPPVGKKTVEIDITAL
jgi:hypothetical protein